MKLRDDLSESHLRRTTPEFILPGISESDSPVSDQSKELETGKCSADGVIATSSSSAVQKGKSKLLKEGSFALSHAVISSMDNSFDTIIT
jgi:hypothetical protein